MRLNSGDVCPKTGAYKVIDKDGKVVNTVYVGEGETIAATMINTAVIVTLSYL